MNYQFLTDNPPWWHQPSLRYVILATRWLGDAVMIQPLVSLLKNSRQAAHVALLAPEPASTVAKVLPGVDQVILLPCRAGELGLAKRWRLAKQLREYQFDVALALQSSWKLALIAYLAKIPHRVGWEKNAFYHYLLTDCRPRILKPVATVEQFCALGSAPGARINITNPELLLPDQPFAMISRTNEVQLALCPGSGGGISKRWPLKKWQQLAAKAAENRWQVLVLGGAKEKAWAEQIAAVAPEYVISKAGQGTLIDHFKYLSQVDYVVANDSGLMHVASALGKPVVAVYGPTAPSRAWPLSKRHQVLTLQLACSPCDKRICPLKHNRCLKDLSVEPVWSSLWKWYCEDSLGQNL